MIATLVAVCYKSKTLKDGTHPLMLRITKDYKIKYVSLGVSLNQKYWDFRKNCTKPNCPNKEYIDKLIFDTKTEYQNKVVELASMQKRYTPQSLANSIEKRIGIKSLSELHQEQIAILTKSGKIGNAEVYGYSLKSLLRFTNDKLAIPISDVTCEWLKRYEKWLQEKKLSENSISQLFRTLRSIYNKAIEAGVASKDEYPFNKFKVSKFNTTTRKRAIAKTEILKILSLDLSSESHYTKLSRDIFLFSYFGAGINFVDIAHLRHSDIKEGRISYIRKKTGKMVNFRLSDEAKGIIETYSTKRSETGYIFPILSDKEHKTPIQIANRIHRVLRYVNSGLTKRIGKLAGVQNLTTYVARHTFATVLKRSGVNIAIISETLGHSDISTTQIYLDSFENSQIDDAMKNLL